MCDVSNKILVKVKYSSVVDTYRAMNYMQLSVHVVRR